MQGEGELSKRMSVATAQAQLDEGERLSPASDENCRIVDDGEGRVASDSGESRWSSRLPSAMWAGHVLSGSYPGGHYRLMKRPTSSITKRIQIQHLCHLVIRQAITGRFPINAGRFVCQSMRGTINRVRKTSHRCSRFSTGAHR